MKYNCNFIDDLLPLYVENIASEKTKNIVEEHLEECPECAKKVGYMKTDLFQVKSIGEGVDFLKKDMRRNKLSYIVWISYAIICALIIIYQLAINLMVSGGMITEKQFGAYDGSFLIAVVLLPALTFISAIALGTEKSLWKLLSPVGFLIGTAIVDLALSDWIDKPFFMVIGTVIPAVAGVVIGCIIRLVRRISGV